jgi:hypothetical protein
MNVHNENPATCSLANFSIRDMTACGKVLRTMGAGASSMEEVAGRIVRYFFDTLVDGKGGQACSLVRFFKTHPYGELDDELQRFARNLLVCVPALPDMRCLVLLGTAGEEEAWNSRMTSQGHQAIPLPSEEAIQQIPMISILIRELGLQPSALIKPDPKLLPDMEQRNFTVFHISDALDSPHIPAQKEFVIPCGIRSVLGFGGLFPSGDIFAVIMFLKVPVSRELAELFTTLSLNVKIALLPFDRAVFARTTKMIGSSREKRNV